MVEAGGVGIFRAIENTELIEKSTRTKRCRIGNWAKLERIWNTGFFVVTPEFSILFCDRRCGRANHWIRVVSECPSLAIDGKRQMELPISPKQPSTRRDSEELLGYALECVSGRRPQTDRVSLPVAAASRRLHIASSTTVSEVAKTPHAMRKARSMPVSAIGRALKSPAIPVHQ